MRTQAHVTIKRGFELDVDIDGVRFSARFLFLPSSLCAGDAVWLRIERAGGGAVDVSARVACVVTDRDSRSAWRPLPGGRFSVTIDKEAAARTLDTAVARCALDDDDERAPTEPNRSRSWVQTQPDTEREATTRDHSLIGG